MPIEQLDYGWSQYDKNHRRHRTCLHKCSGCGNVREVAQSRGRIKTDLCSVCAFTRPKFYNRKKICLDEFLSVRNFLIAYLLGFLWADGNVTKDGYKVSVNFLDDDFQDIKHIFSFPDSWGFYNKKSPNKRKLISCQFHSKVFNNFLCDFDFHIKSGSSACKILNHLPQDMRPYWWRGYFDGDGNLFFDKKQKILSITSCYQQNWDFYIELCDQLEIVPRIYQVKHIYDHSRISIQNRVEILKFLDFIYQGERVGLLRKYNKYQEFSSQEI